MADLVMGHKAADLAKEVGRECGACTLCCTVNGVPGTTEPGVRCKFLGQIGTNTMHEVKIGDGGIDIEPTYHPVEGCTIYDKRPRMCAMWFCGWRLGIGDDADRPDKTGVIPDLVGDVDQLAVGVRLVFGDPEQFPDQRAHAEDLAARLEAGTAHRTGPVPVIRPLGKISTMDGGFDSRAREKK